MLNSLNIAQTGLYVSRQAVENVSNNIANQHTEGYKKRRVELSELGHVNSFISGRGVSSNGAARVTSEYLYNNLVRENSKESYYKNVSEMLGSVETIFKEYEKSGFSSDFDRYFQAVENLRSNPHSEIYKTDLRTQATIVVDSLQRLYEGIETQETYVKTTIGADVKKINSILKDIGELNALMGQQSTPTNDLLDKRDLLELQLSDLIDVEITRRPEYRLDIAGEIALRFSRNIRDVTTYEEYTPQQDRYVKNDGSSNILNGITFDNQDKITYKLDNTHEVSVQFGESMSFDLNGDGAVTTQVVDASNYVRALAHKINTDSDMSQMVKAYNGNYALDANGKKVTIDASDNFLLLEAKVAGASGDFVGRIAITEQTVANDPTTITNRKVVFKDDYQSRDSSSFFGIAIFDEKVLPNSGSLKAKIDNLNTESGKNKFQEYKDKLDNFAKTLSDMTDKFVRVGANDYIYGETAADNRGTTAADVRDIGLFSGSSVKTLKFNTLAVNDLSQVDLDYLSTMQWKKDIGFDGLPQDGSSKDASSFTEFYQELTIGISSDKENNDFLLQTQKTVKQSITKTYERIVNVDNDEEMLDLMKFQAAYRSSAKIITVVDEMLNTLLGLKR